MAQWLVALFLVQAAMPLQAHSRLSTNEQGVAVVICTLQGQQTVHLDLDAAEQAHAQPVSAAMLFSDLVNDTTAPPAALTPPAFCVARSQLLTQLLPGASVYEAVEASSRAPPRG